MSIEYKSQFGRTPLHMACEKGHLDLVKYLVEQKNANISALDNNDNTILHLACFHDNMPVIKFIVEELKFPINIQNKNGWTPLKYASGKDLSNVVKYLLSKGADCNIVDKNNKKPSDYATTPEIKDILNSAK